MCLYDTIVRERRGELLGVVTIQASKQLQTANGQKMEQKDVIIALFSWCSSLISEICPLNCETQCQHPTHTEHNTLPTQGRIYEDGGDVWYNPMPHGKMRQFFQHMNTPHRIVFSTIGDISRVSFETTPIPKEVQQMSLKEIYKIYQKLKKKWIVVIDLEKYE